MKPRMAAVMRKLRPGKERRDSFHSWSKRGTKARGMRDSSRATKVFSLPNSAGVAMLAIIILQTEGTVPIRKVSLESPLFIPTSNTAKYVPKVESKCCLSNGISKDESFNFLVVLHQNPTKL